MSVLWGAIAFVILVLATAIAMIFGELAPKNLAIGRPEQVALSLARPTALLLRLAGPAIGLFDNTSNALLRRIGVEPPTSSTTR